jgi:hypothetical protein
MDKWKPLPFSMAAGPEAYQAGLPAVCSQSLSGALC